MNRTGPIGRDSMLESKVARRSKERGEMRNEAENGRRIKTRSGKNRGKSYGPYVLETRPEFPTIRLETGETGMLPRISFVRE